MEKKWENNLIIFVLQMTQMNQIAQSDWLNKWYTFSHLDG